jgi:hypothetical protein
LGENGTCLVLPKRLPLTQPLHLCFQTEGGPLKAEGRVVWVGPPGGELVRHGVAFTRMAPEHRQALRAVLLAQGHVRPAGVRLSVVLPVTCRCRGAAQPPLTGWTGDISRGGLSLRLAQGLPPATELLLTLHPPAGPLTVAGTIVWVETSTRRAARDSIRHGVQFTLLDAAVDLALARLLTRRPSPAPHGEDALRLP